MPQYNKKRAKNKSNTTVNSRFLITSPTGWVSLIFVALLLSVSAWAFINFGYLLESSSDNLSEFSTLKKYEEYGIVAEEISKYKVHGVDVSAYQGNVDWRNLYQQGVKFAFVKATEGDYFVDDYFEQNWNDLDKTKIIHGAYHFMNYDSSGIDQAELFIETVPRRDDSLPPVVDVEFYGMYNENPPDINDLHYELSNLLVMLEDHYGKEPIIYTTRWIYSTYISEYYDNPIWIASPDTVDTLSDDKQWDFLQYTFWGELEGYDGIDHIDLNIYKGSLEELEEFASKED